MTDIVLPFVLEESGLRGRIIKLDSVLDQILKAHNYHTLVAKLTAEAATLAVLLGSLLKYEGIFTLQAQGDGPVKMLVSDFTSGGDIRACAHIAKDAVISSDQENLLGKGYMAFTVDQGSNTDRYQGIVELKSDDLLEAIRTYFSQSEQIRTGIQMAVAQVNGCWRGSGIMIQDMPEEGGFTEAGEGTDVSESEDNWRRVMMLLQTCTEAELLSPALRCEDLLFRLFHEEGVRIFDAKTLQKGCRCTMEKIEGVLLTLSPDDIEHMAEDGVVKVTCEFCNRDFSFDPAILKSNIGKSKND